MAQYLSGSLPQFSVNPQEYSMDDDGVSKFQAWLARAKPGERYIYASDISVMGDRARLERDCHGTRWEPFEHVRWTAWRAYQDGEVTLFQKRNGEGFDYIAERRG
jgi:hypothetical protein